MALNEWAICLHRAPGSKKVDQHEPEVEQSGHDHDEFPSRLVREMIRAGRGGENRRGAGFRGPEACREKNVARRGRK